MQQNLKFPAQCTVIPAEELEQVSGGAPAWVGALKDHIRPYWLNISGYETSPCAVCSLNGAGGRLFVSLSGRFLICKCFYFVERKLCTLSNRFQIQLPQSQHLLCCPYSLLILGISCGFSRNLFKCSAHL